jgi:hypothetical protein
MHVASPSAPAQRAAGFGTQQLPATGPRIRPGPHRRPHPVGAVREPVLLLDGSQPSSPVPNTWQSGTKEANFPKALYGDK